MSYNFDISSATIRHDMATLEEEGMLVQPHTSAGRIPTDMGYRFYVDDLVDYKKTRKLAKDSIGEIRKQFAQGQIKRKVQQAVHIISHAIPNVGFATLPESRTFYLGLSNVLKKPEFLSDPMQASQVVEVLENNDNFINLLNSVDLEEKVNIFIGKENIIEQIQSCSMIIGKYNIDDYEGFIGILGPTRMNYAYNSVVIEEVIDLLNNE